MPRLDGKVAIITGAAQGIGAVYAQALADEGAKVMIADILDGKPTASRISAQGGTADFIQTDVSDENSVAAMVDATVAKWGGVDILINNAAIWASLRAKPFEDISPEEWDKLMAVNVKGPFLCACAVVPHMRAGNYGRIVNIASGTAYKGTPNFLHYVTSKGAVIAMTRALAREVGEDGRLPGDRQCQYRRQFPRRCDHEAGWGDGCADLGAALHWRRSDRRAIGSAAGQPGRCARQWLLPGCRWTQPHAGAEAGWRHWRTTLAGAT